MTEPSPFQLPETLGPPRRLTAPAGVLIHDPHAPADLIAGMVHDADALIRCGSMLKQGDRSTVVRLDGPSGSLVLKRYNLRHALHTAVHLTMRSRARWSWLNARRLIELGVRTPRPLACLEQRFGPLRLRSFLATPFIAGSSLAQIATMGRGNLPSLEPVARALGMLWQRLGQARITCGDLKATNIIIDADRHPWLIDLDGMRQHRTRWWLARERSRDLDSFFRNWRDDPPLRDVFGRHLRLP